MNEKYKNLIQLENIICQYLYREIKNTNKYRSCMKFTIFSNDQKRNILSNIKHLIAEYINSDINNDIIKDIIELICDTGKMTINDFIEDLTYSNKYFSRNYKSTENDIYKYIKESITPFNIVTDLVNSAFTWHSTKRGFHFYANISNKVQNVLRINNLLMIYLY